MELYDKNDGPIWPLYLFGYGFAAVIASGTIISPAITISNDDPSKVASSDETYYFRSDSCWLDMPYLLGFIIPVAVVIVFNIAIICLIFFLIYKVEFFYFHICMYISIV